VLCYPGCTQVRDCDPHNIGNPAQEEGDETDTRSLTFWTSDIHDATITDMPSVLAKIVEKVIIAATSNVYSMVLTSFNYPSVFERRIS